MTTDAKTKEKYSRRALLARMGLSGALLPLLHAERAVAATAPSGFPKRLVLMATSNGVARPNFWPASDTDPTTGSILSAFRDPDPARNGKTLRSKVLIPAGIDYTVQIDAGRDAGHFTFPTMYSGTYKYIGSATDPAANVGLGITQGPTLDQFVAEELAKRMGRTVLPLVLVQVRGTYSGPISWRSAGVKNKGDGNPVNLFGKVFGSAALPPETVDKLRLRRRSVLDFVAADLAKFGARLGTEDRMTIDAHLQSIRQLEARLTAPIPSPGTCDAKPPPAGDYGTSTNLPTTVKLLSEITVMALKCDVARVASLSWTDNGGSEPGKLPWVSGNPDFHGVAHQGSGGYATKTLIDRWFYTQVANLAKMMDDVPEGPGTTMLDNSVVVCCNDMNEGNAHGSSGIPVVMVGSCGGYFKTGRAVRLGNWASKTGAYYSGRGGVPNNKLLTTLANAMDIPITGFGSSKYPGAIPELRA